MSGGYLIRKRRRRCSELPPHNRHIAPQPRPLTPKSKALPVTPVHHRQTVGRNNIQEHQLTEGARPANEVDIQQSATSVTPSSPLQPGHTFLSPEKTQQSVVAPSTSTYSNRVPLSLADNGSPEPVRGNLQLQETVQNRQGQDYWVSTLNAPEGAVLTGMVQPTIGIHQDQSSQYIVNQYPPIFTKPLPAVQPAHHAPLSKNSQHVACAKCPSIWLAHFESIIFINLEDEGISSLRRSYRDVQQHIYTAHQWHYGVGCALCENLLFYHLGKMMLLEVAEGDFAHVKIELGNSFMTLRQHIQEAHGGC